MVPLGIEPRIVVHKATVIPLNYETETVEAIKFFYFILVFLYTISYGIALSIFFK